MKIVISILLVLVLSACKNDIKSPIRDGNSIFTTVDCATEGLAKTDISYGTVTNPETGKSEEVKLSEVKKTWTAFKPCRTIVYLADYKDENGKIITSNRIKIVATGNRWEYQPEKQDELNIQFEFAKEDMIKATPHIVNKELSSHDWIGQEVTGVIQNEEKVWMHPFRSNQYSYTEVAPFPEVKFPLAVGNTWSGNLSMGNGWGEWENMTVISKYKVESLEAISLPFSKSELTNCWKIVSEGTFDLGTSYHTFWYHEDYGFVKFDYKNYRGQTLVIELSEVIDSYTPISDS